jgi:DNA-binding IclR family transcriptional regulator
MEVGRDVGAVLQALAVLRTLSSSHEPLGLSAIARAAQVSPSTTLNILRTLANERVVAFDPAMKTYRLGLGLLEIAGPLLNRADLELVEPELQRLATRYEATGSIWIVKEGGYLQLARRLIPDEGAIRIEFRPASRLPPYAGAVGAIVAAARGASLAELSTGMTRVRWARPPSRSAYLEGVRRAAQRGYAIDDGHLIRGVKSVASVVRDGAGAPVLVLGVHAFQGQHSARDTSALGAALAALADEVTRAVYRPADAAGGPGPSKASAR